MGCGSMTYYWKDRERALAYVRAGATAAAAAALISAPAPTVQRWCAAEGIRLGRGRPRRGYELIWLAIFGHDRVPRRKTPYHLR